MTSATVSSSEANMFPEITLTNEPKLKLYMLRIIFPIITHIIGRFLCERIYACFPGIFDIKLSRRQAIQIQAISGASIAIEGITSLSGAQICAKNTHSSNWLIWCVFSIGFASIHFILNKVCE